MSAETRTLGDRMIALAERIDQLVTERDQARAHVRVTRRRGLAVARTARRDMRAVRQGHGALIQQLLSENERLHAALERVTTLVDDLAERRVIDAVRAALTGEA